MINLKIVLGNIYSPVYKGQIQNNGLGMNTDVFSDRGKSLINRKGELVCKSPFPSMPIYFWNDKNNKKYKSAYFKKFKNIWHHGDYAERKSNGGYIIYGSFLTLFRFYRLSSSANKYLVLIFLYSQPFHL